MMCLICRQAETVDGLTTVNLERGEMKLVVKNVPAHVCPSCGEAYVEEDLAVRLLQLAEATFVTGLMEMEINYERSP